MRCQRQARELSTKSCREGDRWVGRNRKSAKVVEESAERRVMGNGEAVMVKGGKEKYDGWGVVKHAAWALQRKRGWIQGGDERTCRRTTLPKKRRT